ncbi:MAG: hypothetical protein Q4G13_01940 [Moraxella sp.]|nr:hypothetical protein [Moraxella sp.]
MSNTNDTPEHSQNTEQSADVLLAESAEEPKISVVYKPQYFRRQGKVWLVMALAMLVLWFVLWLFAKSPNTQAATHDERLTTVTEVRDLPSVIKSDELLNEMADAVSPINFDTVVRDLRSYPAEFKDKKYLNDNKNKWTVQVMDVSEHEVITDYLDGRADRSRFAYFRYSDKNNQTRYILTYGIVNSFQEAMGATRTVNFALPSSVRVLPEEMKRYLAMIDNYERAVDAVDFQSNQAREIKLQETTQEIPPEPVKETTPSLSTQEKETKAAEEDTPKLATAPTAKPVNPVGSQDSAFSRLSSTAESQSAGNTTNNNPVDKPTERQTDRPSARQADNSAESNANTAAGSTRTVPVEQATPQRAENKADNTPKEATVSDDAQ